MSLLGFIAFMLGWLIINRRHFLRPRR